jgi:hypothetical protein
VTRPPAGFGDPTCAHDVRSEGVCERCGNCSHDVILNGACLYCGTSELDPIALSPKPPADFIPAEALVRTKSPKK